MKKISLILVGLFVALSLSGCGEETAGDKLDNAIDSTKEASENAIDSMKKALDE